MQPIQTEENALLASVMNYLRKSISLGGFPIELYEFLSRPAVERIYKAMKARGWI
ncbi:MAG: hypothetical protein ACP5KY_08355 [Thermoproteus sp.]